MEENEGGGGGGGGLETLLADGGSRHNEKVFVSVRMRPLNGKEIVRNDVSDWACIGNNTIIYQNGNLSLPERSMYPSAYTFDRVFGSDCSTRKVYQDGAKDIVLSVVKGINASIFAYGQTSSGKTYTMTGITEYTLADIYDYVQKHTERDFHLKFSAMEIYNESVRDLLSADYTPLRLLDDPERGTIVENLTEETIRDWDHVMELLSLCEAQRKIGETSLNETSSRSHQIIRLTIESSPRNHVGRDSASTLVSAVNFVDLAGSERASQSLSAGARLKEGCHINRSLLTLGTVIRKLSKGRSGHIPFRDSKLTRILQSSLGGNSRTAIICTMSPARSHVEQSRNTLLFASCAKEVSTNAQVNMVVSDKALVKHLQRELDRLENELRTPRSTHITSDIAAMLIEKDLLIEKMQKQIENLTMERDDARSQVQDLLCQVENKDNSLTRLNSDDYPHLRVKISPELEVYDPETSIIEDPRSLGESVRTFGSSHDSPRRSESSFDENYVQIHELDDNSLPNRSPPLRPIVRISQSSESDDWDDIDDTSNGASPELCRVVRCVETEEFGSKRYAASYTSSPDQRIRVPSVTGFIDNHSETKDPMSPKRESTPPVSNEDKEMITLTVDEDRKAEPPLKEEDREEWQLPLEENTQFESTLQNPSPWTDQLPKSESCKESTGSTWFNEVENGEKHLTGRAQSLLTKTYTLDNGIESETLSRKDSESSQGTVDHSNIEAGEKNSAKEEGSSITTQRDNQVGHTQAEEAEVTSIQPSKSVKDVGLDPIDEDAYKISSWPSEFKRLQREIVRLWYTCNVSLVHRAYFFLLFSGDPSDSIYMEVEWRRLMFLKEMFSRGHLAVADGRTVTLASTQKALRREREMLTKQMQKKLTEQERESLFLRWGIGLNTKYRRIQLANRLWSKVDDMDHVADSAVVVAKLAGFVADPGHAPKEMFELNFAHQASRKNYSFKRSLIPLL